MGALNIGANALTTNLAALQVIGHNIANVNTPGYSRQNVQLETAGYQKFGNGYFGKGVNIATIERSHDAYLTREQMGDDFYGDGNEFTRHVGSLFFSGGSVLPAGRRWKEGVNPKKAGRAVAAWLRSFDPKHEIKIGTVGYALSRWTEPSDASQASRRGGEA